MEYSVAGSPLFEEPDQRFILRDERFVEMRTELQLSEDQSQFGEHEIETRA